MPSGTLVVLNKTEATASLIDLASGRVHATLPTGDGPHEAAVSPDGRTALVTGGTKGLGRTMAAALASVQAVPGPVVLLAGGRGKDLDFDVLFFLGNGGMTHFLDHQHRRLLVERLIDGDHHAHLHQHLDQFAGLDRHTLGKIADVLAARGELDEALRIRREELLPVFERLGDVPVDIRPRYAILDKIKSW